MLFLSIFLLIISLFFIKSALLEPFKIKNIFNIKKTKAKVTYSEIIPNGDDDSNPVYYNQYEFAHGKLSDITTKKLKINDIYNFYIIKNYDKYEIFDISLKNRKVNYLINSFVFLLFFCLSFIYKIIPNTQIFIRENILLIFVLLSFLCLLRTFYYFTIDKVNNRNTEKINARIIDFEIHQSDNYKIWYPICEYTYNGQKEIFTNKQIYNKSYYKKFDKLIINIPKKCNQI